MFCLYVYILYLKARVKPAGIVEHWTVAAAGEEAVQWEHESLCPSSLVRDCQRNKEISKDYYYLGFSPLLSPIFKNSTFPKILGNRYLFSFFCVLIFSCIFDLATNPWSLPFFLCVFFYAFLVLSALDFFFPVGRRDFAWFWKIKRQMLFIFCRC